jgi:outer membrane protein
MRLFSKICTLICFVFYGWEVGAQDNQNLVLPNGPVDLEEAIGIALRNNPQLKKSDLQLQGMILTHEQSKWQRWPSLNFNASQGFSFGRNIDPFTNQFVQQNISFNNFQLGTSVALYNGLQQHNTIQQNQLNAQASQKEYDAAKNDLMLNVALGYLQILNNQELVVVARSQMAATNEQVVRMERLVEAGAEAQAKLLDLKAQLANEELNLLNAENNLESSKLSLKQIMNLPGTLSLEVKSVDLRDPERMVYEASMQEVYESALSHLPQMEASKLRIAAADRGISIARGRYLPSLSLSAGMSTAYSSAAPSERFIANGQPVSRLEVPSETQFVTIDGQRQFLTQIVTVPGGEYKHFNYFNVLDFNRNSSINLNLRIPIFNNFQARYSVANAKLQKLNATYDDQVVANTIRQNIEQAYITMSNSAKKYSATLNQVRAFEEAFRAAESRFTHGALSSAEFNIAKANLDRGRANLVQAKYDYIFRTKVLDFYMAKPLNLE